MCVYVYMFVWHINKLVKGSVIGVEGWTNDKTTGK